MAINKVDITGINTSSLKTIKPKDMEEMFIELKKTNDKSIRDKLVMGNLKLVLSILKRYNNRNENLDDLFQIGCVGLVKAIDNFDLSYGVKFSTYSVLMIEGEIRKYLRDNNTIRISRSVKENAYKILKYKNDYIMNNGKEPSLEDISRNLNIDKKDILVSLEATKAIISYFDPIYDDGGETIYLYDQLSSKDNNILDDVILKDAINGLKDKEKQVLIDRYVNGKNQVELSKELDISQAQISRIEKNALKNIKKLIK